MKYNKFINIINKKLKKKDNNDDGNPIQIPQTKKRINKANNHRTFKNENNTLHPTKHPREPTSHANYNHFQGPQI